MSVVSSSELCDTCHSSGISCCCHDTARLQFSDDINPAIWLSPVGNGPSAMHEYQFLEHHDTVTWLLGSRHDMTPITGTDIRYQQNPHRPQPPTLDVYSSTTSSSDYPSGSSPMEVSVVGQATTNVTSVPFMGSMLTDAFVGKAGVVKSMTSGEGETATEREARLLRYKEKKKKRKFEKKIRYASRKVYAEMRPRIKGRFAKNLESDQPKAPPHQYYLKQ